MSPSLTAVLNCALVPEIVLLPSATVLFVSVSLPESVAIVLVAMVVAAQPASNAATVEAVPVCPEVAHERFVSPEWSVGEYPLIVPDPARVPVT